MNKKRIIINRPEALSSLRRRTEWGITTIGWILWFFLARPFIIVFLWILGVRLFYEHMVRLGGFQGLREIFGLYLGIILLIFALVRGWNLYNVSKFRKKSRRKNGTKMKDQDMQEFFKINPQGLDDLRGLKNAEVDFLDFHYLEINPGLEQPGRAISAQFHPSTTPPHPGSGDSSKYLEEVPKGQESSVSQISEETQKRQKEKVVIR